MSGVPPPAPEAGNSSPILSPVLETNGSNSTEPGASSDTHSALYSPEVVPDTISEMLGGGPAPGTDQIDALSYCTALQATEAPVRVDRAWRVDGMDRIQGALVLHPAPCTLHPEP